MKYKTCKTCKFSYLDAEEGWNCRKYDGEMILSGGTKINWPGLSISKAWDRCNGDGYKFTLPSVVWVLIGAVGWVALLIYAG